MDIDCIFYDPEFGFIPATCCGDLFHTEIKSNNFEGSKIGSCIGMTPEEITDKRFKIYVEEDFFNRTKDYWFN